MPKFSKFAAVSGLIALLAATFVGAPAANAATATINAVSFKAPLYNQYAHSTGGGAWNDGSVNYDKGELLGTNFACNDWASFLLELNTSALPTKQPAPYTVEVRITYTWDATGQSGASLTPSTLPSHLKVNSGNIYNTYASTSSTTALGTASINSDTAADGGFVNSANTSNTTAGYGATIATSPAPYTTATGTEFSSGATDAVTFQVQGVQTGANVIVRSDAQIHCATAASPTGNLQAALTYVKVVAPGAVENISAGNQTVNFRGVGNLSGLGVTPVALTVTKTVTTAADCTANPTATSINVSTGTLVTFCYKVTNTSTTASATGVNLVDDNATPTDLTDDRTLLSNVTIAPGATTTAMFRQTTAYTTGASYTNTVTAKAANANTVSAQATVNIGTLPEVRLIKTQTSTAIPTSVGDIIDYTIEAQNWGNGQVTVTVTDPGTGNSAVTCALGTPVGSNIVSLANATGGASYTTKTCVVHHTVTASDLSAGKAVNVATASWGSSMTSKSNTVITNIPTMTPTYELSVVKTQTAPTRAANVGDVITYSVLITNIGKGNVTGLTPTDTLTRSGSTPTLTLTCRTNDSANTSVTFPTTLNSGNSILCTTSSYTAVPGDANTTLHNTVNVVTTEIASTKSNTVDTPVGSQPALTMLKLQSSTTIPKAVGDYVDYAMTATNSGNVALTGVVITDNNAGLLDCAVSGTTLTGTTVGSHTTPAVSLSVGATLDCNFRHVVTSSDMTAGSVDNVATVAGLSGSTNVSASSDHVVTPIAAVTINKTTSATRYQSGDVRINYTIDVRNAGQVPLTNVAIVDSLTSPTITSASTSAVTLTCTPSATTLAVGATIQCTGYYTLASGDFVTGNVTNTATVNSVEAASQSSTVVTPFVAANAPDIRITKTRVGTSALQVGDTITYHILVENIGLLDLTGVALTDANATFNVAACTGGGALASATYTVPSLLIGDSFYCDVTHIVTDSEMKATTPQVVNVASVVATQLMTPHTSTVTTPLNPNPQATITKTQTNTVGSVGDVIHYDIVVTNTGNETLTNVVITDPTALVALTCAGPYSIAVGQHVTCTATHTVTSADMTATTFVNTAKMTAAELVGELTATAATSLTAAPSLTVVKSRTGSTTISAAGQIVSYQIVVTNNGNMPLSAVNVTDLGVDAPLTCTPTVVATSLGLNATIVCTGSHAVTTGEVSAGHVFNTASVSSTQIPSTNSNQVDTPVTPATAPTPVPGLSITKALNGAAPAKVGDVVTYKIVVTNTGEVALSGVNVTDANATLGACSVALPATLAVGTSLSCAATHIVTDADMAAGKVDNTAAASSTTGSLNATSNLVSLPLAPVAGLSITKALDGAAPAKTGDVITYKIVVTNTGNVTLNSVTVTDANATIGTCTPGNSVAALAPAATITCAATHVVTNADMLAGKVDNVANVTATSVTGPVAGTSGAASTPGSTSNPIGATSNVVTVPLVFNASISIVKKQVGSLPTDLGGFIHYSIVVTNTGNIALHNVNVTDSNAGYLTCDNGNPAPELAVGASYTCSAKHALTVKDVEAGKVINIASVTTDENAAASSGSSAANGGATTGTTPTTSPAGSVGIDSNEVLTLIRLAMAPHGNYKQPNGGTITLGAAALKNPKLKVLAFTGGEEQMPQDDSLPTLLIALGMAVVLMRRRLSRK